jgi:hypothetical protein
MDANNEMQAYFHFLLASTLDEVKWLASRTGRFIPGERAPGTH